MNDVSASDIDYLSSYPHQMGLIALLELVYRICGPENYHAFQVLNGWVPEPSYIWAAKS